LLQETALTVPSTPTRQTLSWIATFGAGYLAGIAPFLNLAQIVPGVHDLMLLIPQRLNLLEPLTGVLTGALAIVLRARSRIGTAALRRALRIGMAFLPAGLALLTVFQLWFVVRHSITRGRAAISVIVAPPRTRECHCAPGLSDEDCLTLSSSPEAIARCWGRGAVLVHQVLWSSAYLLAVGGLCSCIGFLQLRGEAPEPGPQESPPLTAAAPERRIFLSYSRRDRDFVERLALDLTERGLPVWWDRDELKVGDSLPREIGNAIIGSTWFGIVLSPAAVASRWVQLELDTALALEVETGTLSVLPIVYRPCAIPAPLRSKVYADFTASFESGLAALLSSVG
jgi:hypothetical protein